MIALSGLVVNASAVAREETGGGRHLRRTCDLHLELR